MASPETVALCIVFAHPDDESFGVAGTCAKYAAQGVRAALLCATPGEAGMTGGLVHAPAALAELRKRELRCAAAEMGMAHVSVLDFPDGGAEAWDCAALDLEITGFLRQNSPSVVVTFDPQGVTRHPDHIAVHASVTRVVRASGLALGVRRLFYQVVTCPEEASPEGPSLACVAPDAVDITVDIAAFEAAKRAALRCHVTQAADTANMLSRPEGSLQAEHYQLAWSSDAWRPAPGEGDLLAGL